MTHGFSLSGGRQLKTWVGPLGVSLSICLGPACGGSEDKDFTLIAPELRVPPVEGGGASSPGAGTTRTPRMADEAPIVFRSDRGEEGVGDLYVMAQDGSGVRRITTGGDYYMPEWSPDGETIAFRRGVDGETADVGLIIPDGSPPAMLTQGESALLSIFPVRWSVDGQRLAYASWPEPGSLFVWGMSREGGQSERLLPSVEAQQSSAAWSSPNGLDLAFTDHTGVRPTDLWRVSATDLAAPVNLTRGRVYSPNNPRWSPDGTRIAFAGYALSPDGSVEGLQSHGSVGFTAPDSEIFVIDIETEEVTRVTDNTVEDENPGWASDGQSLLIASNRDGDFDLWLLPLDAPEEARNLIDDASLPRKDNMPSWYPAPL